MNDAHLHLVVNHFPIIGAIFGLGLLIAGLILKNKSIRDTAFIVFIVSAIFAAVSMTTGEGAEEIVEKLPNVTKEIIHEHEEIAEKLALVLYIAGGFSLISLYFSFKKNPYIKYTSIIVAILGAIAVFLSKGTGTSGGEIRHTEIRKDFVPATEKGSQSEKSYDDEKEE